MDDVGVDAVVFVAVEAGSFVESEAIFPRSSVSALPFKSLLTCSVLRWASMFVMVPSTLLPFCSCTETESPMKDFDGGAIAASSRNVCARM